MKTRPFIQIKFGKSISPGYKQALFVARTFDDFSEMSPSRPYHELIICFAEVGRNPDKFKELLMLIGAWRTTIIRLNGCIVDYIDCLAYIEMHTELYPDNIFQFDILMRQN